MTRPTDTAIAEAIRAACAIEGWEQEALIVDHATEALGYSSEDELDSLRPRVQRVYDRGFKVWGAN